jgi:DNA processing protein
MSGTLSQDSQAILLLTAPLMAGRTEPSVDLLTPGEYGRLAHFLLEAQKQVGDLLTVSADHLIGECQEVVSTDRLRRLLGRGFLLSQAVERWQARAIWVVTSADPTYPQRLKERLKGDAPVVLYGCGDTTILATGGLAVVGSRNATPALLTYAERIGQLAAHAEQTIVSGAARGIDQAAMSGALLVGGRVVGMLADSLERAALSREYRSPLMDGVMVLVSPCDPMTGFNVGNAMQRNKLIYALADAALVINSDYQKGGTWAGAVEQLTKLRLVPVFVRSRGEIGNGLAGLQNMGALPWPNPTNATELVRTMLQVTPAPAKDRTKPTNARESVAEPTLFDAIPDTGVPNRRATVADETTTGGTHTQQEGINHAKD